MPEIPFDVQYPTVSSFFAQNPEPDEDDRQTDYAVVDEESATKPGDQYTVLARFDTEQEASEWIGRQDPEKVARGGFGIDGPTEDW